MATATSENGWFVNPDNLTFDPKGRMFVATDGANDFDIPDGTTLFVSVQHPAEDAETLDKVETRWPDFKSNNIPRPAVVAIQRMDGKEVGA